jgi:hypothetical protein
VPDQDTSADHKQTRASGLDRCSVAGAGRGIPSGILSPRSYSGEITLAPMATGRPTKYLPEYCDRVIEFCADGASLTAFAGEIRVSRRTLTYWAEAYHEFYEACEVAKALACRWWEKQLRGVASGDGGPGAATAAIFGVKNFGELDFSDRRQVEHVGHVDHRMLTYDQAVEEARRRGLPERVLEE